jgi:8-oxo-dGTP pyrophosphatase MutT (NUDIX family)
MPMLEKVAALTVRQGAGGLELLVFTHPLAGIQVPAGSVEPGEAPEHAAARETQEETGLSWLRVVGQLGSLRGALLPGGMAVLEPIEMVRGDTGEAWTVKRGWGVYVLEQQGERVRVAYREWDWDWGDGDRQVLWEATGWTTAAGLAAEVERHVVLLACEQPTEAEWDWDSIDDAGERYHCWWAGLERAGDGWTLRDEARLSGDQHAWLRFLPPDLPERLK